MAVLSLLGLLCLLFALAWATRQTMIELAPYLLCGMGLALYVLAFFGGLRLVDWLLLAAGVGGVAWMAAAVRKQGWAVLRGELRRQLADPYLWMCVVLLVLTCLLLRGERILEWDAYNFWGPDVKSLFYREGFAARYSNVAQGFGDYPPGMQLILWWFVHLFGSYQEQFVFFGYFLFSGLMLFSAACVFRRAYPRGRKLTWLLAPVCALALPGVASVALYRSIYVDPLMAILFGMILCKIVLRPEGHLLVWKGELLIAVGFLALLKEIALLWSLLAVVFFLLWWLKEKREYRFALALAALPVLLNRIWAAYCQGMERSGYLSSGFWEQASQRLSELASGTFLDSATTRGYLKAYLQAFFLTPAHRESTWAIDLSPFAVAVLVVMGAAVLWRLGAVPRGKGVRLLAYLSGTTGLIYLVVFVGQLTMFYNEPQYLDPVNALTLMSRYGEPAGTGLLMLVTALASGQAPGARLRGLGGRRPWVMGALAAAVLLSCAGYREAYRRFVYDERDAARISLREDYVQTYQPFLDAIQSVPYQQSGARVLLVLVQEGMNPIVVNEASPVSFADVYLNQGGQADYAGLRYALETNHCGYLYLMECEDSLLELLPQGTQRRVLYQVEIHGSQLKLTPWEG